MHQCKYYYIRLLGSSQWQLTCSGSYFLLLCYYSKTCRSGICQILHVLITRAGISSRRIEIDQFNSNSIPELEQELELKDLEQHELNWNGKILNWN